MEIIIYGSVYGTAKQYAEELGRRLNIDVQSYENIREINAYSTIIYIGALYAGGVLGMKKTFQKLEDAHGKKMILATVGLADPQNEDNIRSIRANMEKQLSAEVWQKAQVFHLRGGINYTELSFKHRTMMALLYRKASALPEEKKTPDSRALVETYNKQISFVDMEHLEPIIQAYQG